MKKFKVHAVFKCKNFETAHYDRIDYAKRHYGQLRKKIKLDKIGIVTLYEYKNNAFELRQQIELN
jgi:hypothetical protein